MKSFFKKINRLITDKFGVEKAQAIRFLALYVAFLVAYTIYGASLIFLLEYQLCPVVTKQSSSYGISDFSKFSLTLERGGSLSITDGSSVNCGGNTSVCFSKNCSYSLVNKDSLEDCVIQITALSAVTFGKFIVSCSSGTCSVDINSTNFHSNNLIVFGEDISIRAENISANNVLYDSKIGNVEIKQIKNAVSAYLSTDSGDIALQLTQSSSFSSLTSTKNVCATTAKAWKSDLTTAITDILDIMIENTTTCLPVYQFKDRDHKSMEDNLQHPVFNKLLLNQFSTSSSNRCFEISTSFLATTASIVPSSVTSPIIVKIANGEGNVFINILPDPTNILSISPPVLNEAFKQSNLKLSTESSSLLTQTLKIIKDSGKTQEIIFLDFNQNGKKNDRLIWVIIFNPIYLYISPKWISLLSLNSLNSEQRVFKPSLSPGMCPYFFDGISDITAESRTATISSIISNLIEKIEVDIFMAVTWQDYKNINLRDRSTYPDVKNIDKGIQIVSISLIIIIISLAVFYILAPSIIIMKTKLAVESNEKDEKKKIYFYFFEYINRTQKQQLSYEQQQQQPEQTYQMTEQQQPILNEKQQQEEVGSSKKIFLSQKEKQFLLKVVNGINNPIISKFNQVLPLDQGKSNNDCNQEGMNIQQLNIDKVQTQSQTFSNYTLMKKESDRILHSSSKDQELDNFKQSPICDGSQSIQKLNKDQAKQKLGVMEIQLVNHFGSSFEHLATNSAAWMQRRFQNSLHFFFSLLFEKICQKEKEEQQNKEIIIDKEKQDESSEIEDLIAMKDEFLMDLRQLKEFYQLFCYYFNFQQEIMLSDQIQDLLSEYGFQIELQQMIIFQQSQIQILESYQNLFPSKIKYAFPRSAQTAVRECVEKIYKTNPIIDKAVFEMIVEKNLEKLKERDQKEENKLEKERKNLDSRIRHLSNMNIFRTRIVTEDESAEDEQEDEELLEQSKQELYSVQANDKYILARRWKSSFKLNTAFIQGLFEMIGSNLMPQLDREDRQLHSDKLVELKLLINSKYFDQLLGITTTSLNSQIVFVQIKAVIVQLIYMLSPVCFCFPLIIFIIIFAKEDLKFSSSNGQLDEKSTFDNIYTFKFPALSLLVLAFLIFVIIFYWQLVYKNTLSLTKLVDSPFIISKKKEVMEENKYIENILKKLDHSIFAALYLFFLTYFLVIINLLYFMCIFIVILLGSILFPKVQLPLVIFIGLLVSIISLSITSFTQQYEKGKETLKGLFQEKLQEKFDLLQKKSLDPDNKTQTPSQNQVENEKTICQTQNRIKLSRERKDFEGCVNEQQQSHKLISPFKQNSQKKDVRFYESDEFSDMFQFIDKDKSNGISEQELRDFLFCMKMEMTDIQINQMFAHVKVEINPNLFRLNLNNQTLKEFDKLEFNLAMNYLLEKKVSQALHYLDISYEVQYLSVFKMIIQSIVIGLFVFSIYEGLSTKESSFDFNTNSIASLGGVIGILFTREDKGKKLQDNKLLDLTVVQVEDLFHQYNS